MKVLLLELNEVTWRLIDPLIVSRELPTFARLVRDGMSATTISADEPPHVDPRTTWNTVYSGTPVPVHTSTLEQRPETPHARRVWEIAGDAGRRVGVYGSLNAWPPHPVRGFIVPDSFAPSPETYPPSLRVVQEMNLRYMRGDGDGVFRDGSPRAAVMAGARLLRLGLRPTTIARVVAQLVRERLVPRSGWRRTCLPTLLNFDVFRRLYRRHRPHFATFHTNHVAHYQRLYWRAKGSSALPHAPLPGEVETYAGAIAHGYRVADRLLKQALRLVDRDTMLVVASGVGQPTRSGSPHPEGMVMFYGRGVRPGRLEHPISTLDLAPTMLRLLRLPVPPAMTGRDLLAAARERALQKAAAVLREA